MCPEDRAHPLSGGKILELRVGKANAQNITNTSRGTALTLGAGVCAAHSGSVAFGITTQGGMIASGLQSIDSLRASTGRLAVSQREVGAGRWAPDIHPMLINASVNNYRLAPVIAGK